MVETAPSLAQLFSASVFRILLGCSVSKVSTHSCITDTFLPSHSNRSCSFITSSYQIYDAKTKILQYCIFACIYGTYLLVISGYISYAGDCTFIYVLVYTSRDSTANRIHQQQPKGCWKEFFCGNKCQ